MAEKLNLVPAIREVEAQIRQRWASKMGWISVKKMLPEELPENLGRKSIPCIVALKSCYPNGKPTIQKRQRQWIPSYDGMFIGWEWSRIGSQRVTHWMPLPDPPIEE